VEQLRLPAIQEEGRLVVPLVVVDPERREALVALMAQALVAVHEAHADRRGDDRASR
jgi:hypothetical protein